MCSLYLITMPSCADCMVMCLLCLTTMGCYAYCIWPPWDSMLTLSDYHVILCSLCLTTIWYCADCMAMCLLYLTTMWYCVYCIWPPRNTVLTVYLSCDTVLTVEYMVIRVWLQHSKECNLVHFIAAVTSHHQWMCTITYCEGFIQNPPALCSAAI